MLFNFNCYYFVLLETGGYVMTTIDHTPFYRNSIGFDRLLDLLDSATHTDHSKGYPPYNIEVLDDPMQIQVRHLKQLVQPMHQFHVRISTKFAEGGCPFHRLVGRWIELGK